MSFNIVPVKTFLQKRDFIRLPWLLHAKNPHWVPPLRHLVKKNLNTRKHPFYKHAELILWLAYKNGKPVGRIAGIVDQLYNDFHQANTAFWGFFETENCAKTATALLQTVENWAKQKKLDVLKGPMNPSMNYECGMQISAFDKKPYLMMAQNPSYYPALVEAANHVKAMDAHAWLINHRSIELPEKLLARKEKSLDDIGIELRCIDMSNYFNEIEKFIHIYNDAWEKNWGFVPMTEAEVRLLAKEIKPLIIPELAYFIMVNGEPAACALCLPNINQVLAKIPSGKLMPLGFIKLIHYLKKNKKNCEGRIPLLGVRKKFRHLQLGPLLYAKYGEVCAKLDMGNIECSWILETNKPMNFGLKQIKAELYKTYRIYEKLIEN
ncbi:MAG: hypothetical protein LCH30_07325 [Proteobacteria bacterium]|nr:hypothetical protein [Pseudomonadota bacterium]